MAEIVNLRMARKAKARADARAQAEEARARHGASKATREKTSTEIARLERTVEGARREKDTD
ncbi:DUF4169 family protein [Novosphingobium mangrovi (ex Hu et al. 2023)]|uniref:DUF4169 family protein n=1 Tax=Novosphingobium mangrovi (ex Hu et al. 2023) TaxID=2930094 RepID=A0ABT0AFQ1_9SPHN|nr:DUF4169 family protein [Novosphingobium mangrovi (ex Hu et al. 2023)]MCJ1962041.1 DUF4169 family protein [Novosphingobium mangrovi (ex Hu et al. 2023)]